MIGIYVLYFCMVLGASNLTTQEFGSLERCEQAKAQLVAAAAKAVQLAVCVKQ